jgi:hypothetical protein
MQPLSINSLALYVRRVSFPKEEPALIAKLPTQAALTAVRMGWIALITTKLITISGKFLLTNLCPLHMEAVSYVVLTIVLYVRPFQLALTAITQITTS